MTSASPGSLSGVSTCRRTGTGERVGERGERGLQAGLGEHHRVQPSRQLTQVGGRLQQACPRRAHAVGHGEVSAGFGLLGQGAELQSEGHQLLLGAVMQVALDPAAGRILGGDDAPRRRLELLCLVLLHDDEAGLRSEVGEQAVLRGGEGLAAGLADRDGPAHAAVVDDRVHVPPRSPEAGERHRCVLVLPGRPPCLRHQMVLAAHPDRDADGADSVRDGGGDRVQERLRRVLEVGRQP